MQFAQQSPSGLIEMKDHDSIMRKNPNFMVKIVAFSMQLLGIHFNLCVN